MIGDHPVDAQCFIYLQEEVPTQDRGILKGSNGAVIAEQQT